MEIIIATKNLGKVADFETLFKKRGINVKSLLDYPNIPDIDETGKTFVENAILKAESIATYLNKPVIADDSGLAIDVLNGRPGIYSARYAGQDKNDQANIQKVLAELTGVPHTDRTARFHCALAVAAPNRTTHVFEGTCDGIIAESQIGDSGFGYDPIFFLPEKNMTMAQLSKEEKNEISHRSEALQKLEQDIDSLQLIQS